MQQPEQPKAQDPNRTVSYPEIQTVRALRNWVEEDYYGEGQYFLNPGSQGEGPQFAKALVSHIAVLDAAFFSLMQRASLHKRGRIDDLGEVLDLALRVERSCREAILAHERMCNPRRAETLIVNHGQQVVITDARRECSG